MRKARLILASSSPRRRRILLDLGLEFETQAVTLAEVALPHEAPGDTAQRLAREKALAAAPRTSVPANPPGTSGRTHAGDSRALWLGADTIVVLDGEMLGKPADLAEAARMLSRLSGRTHDVLTGLALLEWPSGSIETGISRTHVCFAPLSDRAIAEYIAVSEPLDKAGAYGIQERGAWFVERTEGSYTNVVGLPVELLRELLARFGLTLADLSAT